MEEIIKNLLDKLESNNIYMNNIKDELRFTQTKLEFSEAKNREKDEHIKQLKTEISFLMKFIPQEINENIKNYE